MLVSENHDILSQPICTNLKNLVEIYPRLTFNIAPPIKKEILICPSAHQDLRSAAKTSARRLSGALNLLETKVNFFEFGSAARVRVIKSSAFVENIPIILIARGPFEAAVVITDNGPLSIAVFQRTGALERDRFTLGKIGSRLSCAVAHYPVLREAS